MIDTVININGWNFETNDCIYQVVPKYDPNAPEGYRDLKTTKLPNRNSGRSILSVPYNESAGLWDTGLYKGSPMYSNFSEREKEEIFNQVEELVVKPYVEKFGSDKLDPRDIDSPFWNRKNRGSFKIELYDGKIFNTRKPEDLLQLYIAVSLGKLAPKEQESSYLYTRAQFCVENKDNVQSIEQHNELQETECIYKFKDLLNKKPEKLSVILNYIGIKPPTDMNEGLTTRIFLSYINNKKDKYQNRDIFLETVHKSTKKNGFDELYTYKELQTLYKRGVIKKRGEYFFIDGEEIGLNTLKNCAANVVNNPNMQAKILDLKENK